MLLSFFLGSPTFLSSLPGSASLSDEGWRKSSHHWLSAVLSSEES